MARRRELKSVLRGFLGTFTSRYSDYEGYWIFGMLVADLREATIDLIGDADAGMTGAPFNAACGLARTLFREQLAKGGLQPSVVREGRVDIRRSSALVPVLVHGFVTDGYELTMAVTVVSDLGTVYQRTESIVAAPHDPRIESRCSMARGSPTH